MSNEHNSRTNSRQHPGRKGSDDSQATKKDETTGRIMRTQPPDIRRRRLRTQTKAELLLLASERLLFLLAGQARGHIQIRLAFIAAEVEHIERAKRFARCLQLALHTDEPLARGVNTELAEIGGDPFAPQLLRHRRAAAAEKVRHQIAFVAARFDDALEQGFGLLGGVAQAFISLRIYIRNVIPNCLKRYPVLRINKILEPRHTLIASWKDDNSVLHCLVNTFLAPSKMKPGWWRYNPIAAMKESAPRPHVSR